MIESAFILSLALIYSLLFPTKPQKWEAIRTPRGWEVVRK
jgi:hypothetical protein